MVILVMTTTNPVTFAESMHVRDTRQAILAGGVLRGWWKYWYPVGNHFLITRDGVAEYLSGPEIDSIMLDHLVRPETAA